MNKFICENFEKFIPLTLQLFSYEIFRSKDFSPVYDVWCECSKEKARWSSAIFQFYIGSITAGRRINVLIWWHSDAKWKHEVFLIVQHLVEISVLWQVSFPVFQCERKVHNQLWCCDIWESSEHSMAMHEVGKICTVIKRRTSNLLENWVWQKLRTNTESDW